jgi:shikimate kinase
MGSCWILLGMMGAGKSSVGRALAELTGRAFEDTDQLLQRRFGRAVHQIFSIYGEECFRQHENSILKSLEPSEIILATGGGIVTQESNWIELKRLGTTIYLKSSLEHIIHRLEHSKKVRPLLQTENWKERVETIFQARQHLYERADLTLELDGVDQKEAAAKIIEALQESNGS